MLFVYPQISTVIHKERKKEAKKERNSYYYYKIHNYKNWTKDKLKKFVLTIDGTLSIDNTGKQYKDATTLRCARTIASPSENYPMPQRSFCLVVG